MALLVKTAWFTSPGLERHPKIQRPYVLMPLATHRDHSMPADEPREGAAVASLMQQDAAWATSVVKTLRGFAKRDANDVRGQLIESIIHAKLGPPAARVSEP